MRKILTSALCVAGLLGVVLALATSPASAARSVVTLNTAPAGTSVAGVYTVSWETAGGCDPGPGTSGASGSITITVNATNEETARGALSTGESLAVGVLTGNAGQEFVTVNDDCTYKWTGSLVEAAQKAVCALTGLPGSTDAISDTVASATLTVDGTSPFATSCAPGGLIRVVIQDGSETGDPAVLCTQAIVDGGGNTACDAAAEIGDVLTPSTLDDDDVSAEAIKATGSFDVTARPVPKSKDQCQPVSGTARKDRSGDIVAELAVTGDHAIVDGSLTSVNCEYDVEISLPDGFAGSGADGEGHKARNIGSGDDPNVSVVVATRTVYLIQEVDGDAGGARATYRFRSNAAPGNKAGERCVASLPGALMPAGGGGIESVTTVELREGTFNISDAIPGASFDGIELYAMDHKAVPCHASATVRDLPAHCSAENPTNVASANLVTDARGDGSVLITHVIACVEPAAEEPAATDMDEPADPAPADDMSSDMSSDTMDDPEPMGPPADVATG